ncbi:hypothetical protein ACT80S_06505 [Ramlibacter sp. MAHUQ-53]|uniref:hypothetical protein n=1 Tax=unclassified Ramlibacter TaxID=2617605 RepID=UPI003642DEF3
MDRSSPPSHSKPGALPVTPPGAAHQRQEIRSSRVGASSARLHGRLVGNALQAAELKSPARAAVDPPPETGAPLPQRHRRVLFPQEDGAGPAAALPPKLADGVLDLGVGGVIEPRTFAVVVANALDAYRALPPAPALKALADGLVVRSGRLPAPVLAALGEVLAGALAAAGVPRDAAMQALVQDLLAPVAQRGDALDAAALALGLRRADPPQRRRDAGPGPALLRLKDPLRAWVDGARRDQGEELHAMLVCALELGGPAPDAPVPGRAAAGGPHTRRVLASGPDTLGRLLARDPVQLLQVEGMGSLRKLSLAASALRLMAADNPARLQAPYARLAREGPQDAEWLGFLVLLRQGRESAGVGVWSAAHLKRDTQDTLLRMTLTQAAPLWADQVERIAEEADERLEQEDRGLRAAWASSVEVETKGGAAADPAVKAALERSTARVGAWRRQQEAQAEERAVAEVVGFLAGFQEGAWLAIPGRKPSQEQRSFVEGRERALREFSALAWSGNSVALRKAALLADAVAARLADALSGAAARR